MEQQTTNLFVEELKKCVGKEVIVTDVNGNEIKGICVAISFQYLNVVIRTDTEKMIIKNVNRIVRVRSNPKKKKATK